MKYCAGHIKYLIAIKELTNKDEYVRCADIARHLGVSRPGVSKMLRCLANSGYVYEDYGNSVVLTPEGKKAVNEIFGAFGEIYVFFHKFLKLPHEQAHDHAVRFVMEYPEETCHKLCELVKRSAAKKTVHN